MLRWEFAQIVLGDAIEAESNASVHKEANLCSLRKTTFFVIARSDRRKRRGNLFNISPSDKRDCFASLAMTI
jgi:hypothetical protein